MNFWLSVIALVGASAVLYYALSINQTTEQSGGQTAHGHGHH